MQPPKDSMNRGHYEEDGKPIMTDNELVFANDLNRFFCFDFANNPEKCADLKKTITPMSADRIVITVDKARCIFQGTNS